MGSGRPLLIFSSTYGSSSPRLLSLLLFCASSSLPLPLQGSSSSSSSAHPPLPYLFLSKVPLTSLKCLLLFLTSSSPRLLSLFLICASSSSLPLPLRDSSSAPPPLLLQGSSPSTPNLVTHPFLHLLSLPYPLSSTSSSPLPQHLLLTSFPVVFLTCSSSQIPRSVHVTPTRVWQAEQLCFSQLVSSRPFTCRRRQFWYLSPSGLLSRKNKSLWGGRQEGNVWGMKNGALVGG